MPRRVLVVGTGLIGTSIALALAEHGAQVLLADRDPAVARLAAERGAGEALAGGLAEAAGAGADLAVLAVPPEAVPETLFSAQKHQVAEVYTDVAGVKEVPLQQAARLGCDLTVFAGGHPLGGRERSGPLAARAGLFHGRSWVLCPTAETGAAAIATVTALARACGASPVTMTAAEHDQAIALISHAPHAVASAMAARFVDVPDSVMALTGQGARDVTRIAAGAPELWLDIMSANALPIARVLEEVARDLTATATALRADRAEPVGELLVRGREGHHRIPAASAETPRKSGGR